MLQTTHNGLLPREPEKAARPARKAFLACTSSRNLFQWDLSGNKVNCCLLEDHPCNILASLPWINSCAALCSAYIINFWLQVVISFFHFFPWDGKSYVKHTVLLGLNFTPHLGSTTLSQFSLHNASGNVWRPMYLKAEPCFQKRVGPDDIQRSLPIQIYLCVGSLSVLFHKSRV